ncbi:MAG: PEP-CTERM system histidine kinase PrsK [Burkholderiales bacterium]|nr:PEP-CTERM system histidine kinase PrsK [Burkholderiales bacterium]
MMSAIGSAGHAITSVAFVLLALLLATSWRGRAHGIVLTVVCLISSAWAALISYRALAPGAAHSALEALRSASWFAFLFLLLGLATHVSGHFPKRLKALATIIAVFCAVLLASAFVPQIAFDGDFSIGARVLLAVIGVVLVEQIYRNTQPGQRAGIRYLCLGVGGMFAFDFYLYSDVMLFRRLDTDLWNARGPINAMIVPLIAISAARSPRWSLDFAVSHRILFHSATLFGAGVYLLVMAAVGYYIRYFGGSWGAALQVTFMFGAMLLLLLALFSGTLRARLKVFLSKHFFNYRYDYREEWLHFTRMLSAGEPGVKLHERSIQAIAELVDSHAGALWLLQENGKCECTANWNMPCAASEALDGPFCRYLESEQWVINLQEYRAQPEIYARLGKLPDWLRDLPRAQLVVPLILHERLLGFVVLAEPMGKIDVNWEVADLLKTAGQQAASYLAQLEAAKALLVARQFESFNRMSAFVVHDLKNLVGQLSLLLTNTGKHSDKPEFREDVITTVENSVGKMKRLLLELRRGQSAERPGPIALDATLACVIAGKAGIRPAPILTGAPEGLVVIAASERLQRVIGHLIQNAIEATPEAGAVKARAYADNDLAIIEISDTGCGMSEQFIRTRLFKPFESAKAVGLGMGLGAYEAYEYVREWGGRIEVDSIPGKGSTFRVLLPLHITPPDESNHAQKDIAQASPERVMAQVRSVR